MHFSQIATKEVRQPLLIIREDYQACIKDLEKSFDSRDIEAAKQMTCYQEELEDLHRNSPNSKILIIPDALHYDFTDFPFRQYLERRISLEKVMKVHTIVLEFILKFFQKFL